MNPVLGIILIVLGVAYPMGALVWLNQRLSRQPGLTPRRLGFILALNGIVPIGFIFWGLGLLSPKMAGSLPVRTVAIVATVAALILLLSLLRAESPIPGPSPDTSPDENVNNGG